jgi:hypothetical protein
MNVEVSSNLGKAKALAEAVLGSPDKTVPLALLHVVQEVKSGAATLTPDDLKVLKQLIAANESKADSPELAQTGGREITLKDGATAIEMHVVVNGETVRAVLSDASFNKVRSAQEAYAEELGGRMATRKENRAVADALLEKEEKGTLNEADKKLLKTYREKYVRDSEGGLDVDGRRVRGNNYLNPYDLPYYGALVVLPLAESK